MRARLWGRSLSASSGPAAPFSPIWTFDALLTTYVGGLGPIGGPILGALFFILVQARLALSAWYVAGATPPVLLLWWYQWRSFGDPFRPGQHWMPPVAQYVLSTTTLSATGPMLSDGPSAPEATDSGF